MYLLVNENKPDISDRNCLDTEWFLSSILAVKPDISKCFAKKSHQLSYCGLKWCGLKSVYN